MTTVRRRHEMSLSTRSMSRKRIAQIGAFGGLCLGRYQIETRQAHDVIDAHGAGAPHQLEQHRLEHVKPTAAARLSATAARGPSPDRLR